MLLLFKIVRLVRFFPSLQRLSVCSEKGRLVTLAGKVLPCLGFELPKEFCC